MRPIYMDHSATTPVDPEVFNAMIPYFIDRFANPSSVHSYGQDARRAVEKAREQVAKLINASGEKSANGTKIILWTHDRVPNNWLITFTKAD